MSKPCLIDGFCKAGGATKGYQRAGWYVVGVDIEPQPRYCGDEFYQADALEFIAKHGWEFDAIHASPPCQAFTLMSNRARAIPGSLATRREDLLTPILKHLRQLSTPWVVENVQGASSVMRTTLKLHGGMFGLGVVRPRLFESNVLCLEPQAAFPRIRVGVYGRAPDGRRLWGNHPACGLRAARSLREASEAMGIDWMTWDEIREAIPPAYCQWIGEQLMRVVRPDGDGRSDDSLPSRSLDIVAFPDRRRGYRLNTDGLAGNGSFGRSRQSESAGNAVCSLGSGTDQDAAD